MAAPAQLISPAAAEAALRSPVTKELCLCDKRLISAIEESNWRKENLRYDLNKV